MILDDFATVRRFAARETTDSTVSMSTSSVGRCERQSFLDFTTDLDQLRAKKHGMYVQVDACSQTIEIAPQVGS